MMHCVYSVKKKCVSPNLRFSPGVCMDRLRKILKSLVSVVSVCPRFESGPADCEAILLPLLCDVQYEDIRLNMH